MSLQVSDTSRTLSSRNYRVTSAFFLLCLSLIIPQRACPNKDQCPLLSKDLGLINSLCLLKGARRRTATLCSLWLGEIFSPMNVVPIGIMFSFFCLLSCNRVQGKKAPYFFQLSLRRFYCGIGHIFFSKVSMGLNAGADTQIPPGLISRGMRFMLLRTNGGNVCVVYRSLNKLLS